MTIIDRIATTLGYQRADLAPTDERAAQAGGWSAHISTFQIGRPQWPERTLESYHRSYRNLTTVYSCVQVRSKAVSTAPVRVYRDVDGNLEEQPDHPLRALMARPNPGMSEAEFLAMTQTLVDVCGFCVIEKERGAAGRVVALWHLRPDWLQVVPRRNGAPDWNYRVPGREPVNLRAADVIVVTGAGASDMSPYGLSPIAVALREVGIEDASTEFLKLFIDSGGSPRQALVTPQTIADQAKADAMRERFAQTYSGFRNWLGVVLLSGGLDVKQIGSSLDEMAYPEIRALTEARICAAFGVPPILAGAQVGIDASTYSNYEQARRAFFEDTVSALWSRLDGAIERSLLPEFEVGIGYSVGFDLTGVVALRDDIDAAWTRATAALNAGAITLNQFQTAVGLPGFGDDGDVLYLPMAATPTRPADLLLDTTPEPVAPAPSVVAVTDGAPAALPAGDDAETPPATDETDRAALRAAIARYETPDVRVEVVPYEARSRIVVNSRRNVSRLAAKAAPAIARLFASQGERIADAVRQRAEDGMDTRDIMDAFDLLDLFDDEVAEALQELYVAAGRSAYTFAGKTIGLGIDYDAGNPYVKQTMRDLANRVKGINNQTRDDIRQVVTDATSEGTNMRDLADRLRGLYQETYRNRSLTIARTESQVAYNLSQASAYRQSGSVYAMQLFDNPDHVDDYGASDGLSCADRNGLITDVDKVDQHIFAEHPNGTLAAAPLLVKPLGEF